MMQTPDIIHVFNSALVSGPETLVVPNLAQSRRPIGFLLLHENRAKAGSESVSKYLISFGFIPTLQTVRSRFDLYAIYKIRAYLLTLKPKTIVHTHGPKASLYIALAYIFISSKRRPRLITTHHGVRATDTRKSLQLFELIYEKVAIPFYKHCLTVCSSDLEILANRGVSREKLVTHMNGTTRTLIEINDTRATHTKAIRQKWALDFNCGQLTKANTKIIGIVARLAIEKRHHLALETLKKLDDSNIYLLIYGSGPLHDELRKQSVKLNIQNNVIFAGYKSNVSSDLVGLDALLSLSSAEGLPINLIESAWCGTPIIATAVDGVNDLIPTNDYGWRLSSNPTVQEILTALKSTLFDSSDAIIRAKKLQHRVANMFSTESWNKKLFDIYSLMQADI